MKSAEDTKSKDESVGARSVIAIAVSIVGVVLTGVIGAVAAPDQAATILSFTSGLVVVLIASMREMQKTYHAVNSRMGEMLELTRDAYLAKGEDKERRRAEHESEQSE